MTHHQQIKLPKRFKRSTGIVVIVLVITVGVSLLLISHAATSEVKFEVEAGVISGHVGTVSDSNASVGKAVQFQVAPAARACVKPATPADPAPIGLNTNSPGLKQQIDPAQHYTVYGHTVYQIRDELNQCSPVNDNGRTFDAVTNGRYNDIYSWYTKPNGLCNIKNVAVGLHVSFVFPQWTASSNDDLDVAKRWSTYMTNLTTHENGHKAIAVNEITKLYNDMQIFPDHDCASVVSAVNNYTTKAYDKLSQDESDYDMQTQHGATQGAVFP